MPSKPLIEVSNVTKRFGRVDAVRNVSLSVDPGEFVSLLGPSGCGKTTTLNLIAGFIAPDEGRILFRGESVHNLPPEKRNLGMVFQSYALFPHLNVLENVRFGLRMHRVTGPKAIGECERALSLVQLNDYSERRIGELSGGQRQRVALARAIVTQPIALLLDEPLSALDAGLRQEMRAELREIQRRTGIATILVTHDQDEALALSDRIVVMRDGSIEQSGSPMDVYNASTSAFVARFVGESNFIAGIVESAEGTEAVVAAEGLRVHAKTDMLLTAGQRVQIAIRPERIRVDPPARLDNQFSGVVDAVVFLGATTNLKVRVGPSLLSVRVANTDGPCVLALGTHVVVGWDRTNTKILNG